MKLTIITGCLILLFNRLISCTTGTQLMFDTTQYGFNYKDTCNYINNNNNIPNITSNVKQLNNNKIHNDRLNKYKIILINKNDIKKGNIFDKAIMYNNAKILIGKKYDKNVNCYKLIIKKPNHRKIFEKLISNNRKKQSVEEDIDVLANFRLEQIIKNFNNKENNEIKNNIKDWREEFWSDRKLPAIDNNILQNSTLDYDYINNNINNTCLMSYQDTNNTSLLTESLQSKDNYYLDKNIQTKLDNNIQTKIDRLYKLYNELSRKYCIL